MNLLQRIGDSFFNPLWPILLYLFMAITTLHMQIPFLLDIHIEALTLMAAVLFSLIHIYFHEKKSLDYNHPLIISITLGSLFIISPIVTSLVNQDQLAVLQDEEYKTLFKMILFVPCLFPLIKKQKERNILLNSVIGFYSIFAIYFLYRYLVLHEVRDFDQRPLLKIRHGDPNFLCTFFSMMIPFPLMQAWFSYEKKEKLKTFIYSIAAFLLLFSAILTESRMGLIAAFLGIGYLITRPIFSVNKTILISIFLGGVAIIGLSGDRLVQRFSEIQDKSNADRYLTWKNGIKVFFDNPFFGSGMHKAKLFYYQNTTYPHFQSEVNPLEVHNTFLKAASELGLLGFVTLGVLFLWPWKKSFQINSSERYFLLSSMGILTLSIMTIGLIYKDLFVLHLFFIAALAGTYTQKNEIIEVNISKHYFS